MKTPSDIVKESETLLRETTACNKHKDCPITCDVGVLNAFTKFHFRQLSLSLLESVGAKCVSEMTDNPHQGSEFSTPRYYRLEGYNQALDDLSQFISEEIKKIK